MEQRTFGLIDAAGVISLTNRILICEWAWVAVTARDVQDSWALSGIFPLNVKQLTRYCNVLTALDEEQIKTRWDRLFRSTAAQQKTARDDEVLAQVTRLIGSPGATVEKVLSFILEAAREFSFI